MKRFIIEQSNKEFYTSNSGLVLVGHCINELCSLPVKAGKSFPVSSGGIGMDDISCAAMSDCSRLAKATSRP